LERGEYKLLSALRSAASDIAARRKVKVSRVFVEMQWDDPYAPAIKDRDEAWRFLTNSQRENWSRWFSNLNTGEEFAEAERHLGALDT
jgi:hypothetical protein